MQLRADHGRVRAYHPAYHPARLREHVARVIVDMAHVVEQFRTRTTTGSEQRRAALAHLCGPHVEPLRSLTSQGCVMLSAVVASRASSAAAPTWLASSPSSAAPGHGADKSGL